MKDGAGLVLKGLFNKLWMVQADRSGQDATLVGTHRQVSADIGAVDRSSHLAGVGSSRRDLAGLATEVQFLKADDIATEFVRWLFTFDSDTSRGWPVPIDKLWKYALWFEHQTGIVIESQNNFFEALAKRPEVQRTRNKRIKTETGQVKKTTVYRFMRKAIKSESTTLKVA